jgi:hypothetical protein
MSRYRDLIAEAEKRQRYERLCEEAKARDERRWELYEKLRGLAHDLHSRGHDDLARQAVDLAQRLIDLDRVTS